MATKCPALTRTGAPCRGTPRHGREHCFSHDPEIADRRHQGSIRGGFGKRATVRARKKLRDAEMEPRDVAGLLCLAMHEVSAGTMEPGVGQALGSMARSLMAVQETCLLSDRLAELEHAAGIEPANVIALDAMERRRA